MQRWTRNELEILKMPSNSRSEKSRNQERLFSEKIMVSYTDGIGQAEDKNNNLSKNMGHCWHCYH